MSNLLHNLGIVGRISEQDKIVTEGVRFTIRAPSMLREVSRRWYGEGREHNIEALRSLFFSALMLMQLVDAGETTTVSVGRDRLLNEIRQALVGLRNLQQTYRDDVDTVSRLSVLEQECVEQLSKYATDPPSSHDQDGSATSCRDE